MTDVSVRASWLTALRLPFMRPYFVALLCDNIGDFLWFLTLGWVASQTDTALTGGLLITAGALPVLVLAPIGGVLLGRLGAGRATVATLTCRTAVMLVWVAAVAVADTPLLVLAVLAVALGCIDGLHQPALETWPMDITSRARDNGHATDRLQTGIAGLERLVARGAQTGAGVISGLTLGTWGVAAPAVVGAGLFVVALAVFAHMLRRRIGGRPDTPAEREEDMLSAARGGFSDVAADSVLSRTVPAHGIFNALTAGLTLAGLPLKVRDEGWSAGHLGTLFAAWGLGLLVGALLLLQIDRHIRHKVSLALWLVMAAGLVCGALGLAHSLTAATVAAAALGLCCGPVGPSLAGYFREAVLDRPGRGPMVGVQTLALGGFEAGGYFIVGLLATLTSITGACLVIGGVIVAVGLWALASRDVRAAIS